MYIARAGDCKALIILFDGKRGVTTSISNDRAVVSDGRTSAWKPSLLGMPAAYLISTYCSASVSHTHVHTCLTFWDGRGCDRGCYRVGHAVDNGVLHSCLSSCTHVCERGIIAPNRWVITRQLTFLTYKWGL